MEKSVLKFSLRNLLLEITFDDFFYTSINLSNEIGKKQFLQLLNNLGSFAVKSTKDIDHSEQISEKLSKEIKKVEDFIDVSMHSVTEESELYYCLSLYNGKMNVEEFSAKRFTFDIRVINAFIEKFM